jgi:flagellar hook-basal body complex protein FliE
MSTTNISSAAAAYRDASRIAERILQETRAGNTSETKPTQASFSTMIGESLRKAAATGYNSEAVATRALAGKADVTDVVTAIADAELSLSTVIAVRDRVISAYQDIIKMPI